MLAVAQEVILSTGARRAVIAFGAGAAGSLAMAPASFGPALVLSFTLGVLLMDGVAAEGTPRSFPVLRAAASVGWFFGFGYFAAGLWWLGNAFLVEAEQFAWALPLGVLGLPAVLALFTAAGFAAAGLLWSSGPRRVLAMGAGLGGAEVLRGFLFTGFPWNSFGMALAVPPFDQSASVVGLHGLTVLAIVIASAPATLFTELSPRDRFGPSATAVLLLAVMAAAGAARLAAAESTVVSGVRLRLLQPAVPQDAKFRPSNGPAILERYRMLSSGNGDPDRPALSGITHLVWPESAFPFVLGREPVALARIGDLLRPSGTVLITGAVREDSSLPGEGGARYFNSIQAIGPDGAVLAGADKVHLVPFGEYLPLERLLSALGLRRFVHAPGAFAAGDRLRILPVPGLDGLVPLVCYEAIFPGEVIPSGQDARLMLNVTNDAWFGDTPGPRQHFAQARLRTIEEGLPLVRAANTGVTAVVDPYGRVRGRLDMGEVGFLDADLPAPGPRTIFSSLGHSAAFVLWLAVLIGALTFPQRRY
jgi:apolipoprotein N-acyltransferase